MKIKPIFLNFLITIPIIFIFTLLDWFVHQTNSYLSVPDWYFRNKIIFGGLYIFLILLFTEKFSIIKRSLIVTFVTISLLQIRYVMIGYNSFFHSVIYPSHLVILFLVSGIVLYFKEKYSEH